MYKLLQGDRRERTYCPSTFFYAHSYVTSCKYSDILAQHRGNPVLAHERVLSIICQMSNKDAKHSYCANAHAPSAVASGLLICLEEYYQPKVYRVVQMEHAVDFPSRKHMIEDLNKILSIAPDFAEIPPLNTSNQLFEYKTGEKLSPTRSVRRQMLKKLSTSQTRPRAG